MPFFAGSRGQQFHLLNYGLAVILVFIGTKMCLIDVYKIPVASASLAWWGGYPALTILSFSAHRQAASQKRNADSNGCDIRDRRRGCAAGDSTFLCRWHRTARRSRRRGPVSQGVVRQQVVMQRIRRSNSPYACAVRVRFLWACAHDARHHALVKPAVQAGARGARPVAVIPAARPGRERLVTRQRLRVPGDVSIV
jgi:hypothetical protein